MPSGIVVVGFTTARRIIAKQDFYSFTFTNGHPPSLAAILLTMRAALRTSELALTHSEQPPPLAQSLHIIMRVIVPTLKRPTSL